MVMENNSITAQEEPTTKEAQTVEAGGPVVLLVDDETLPPELYVRALQRVGFHVKREFDPDNALAFAKGSGYRITAIILDMMMPPGSYGNPRTEEGLTTGVLLYADLRQLCPDIPIIVTTNTANQETLQQFSPMPMLRVVQKIDYTPRDMADLLLEMIEEKTSLSAAISSPTIPASPTSDSQSTVARGASPSSPLAATANKADSTGRQAI